MTNDSSLELRSPQAVAQRCMALIAITSACAPVRQPWLTTWVENSGIKSYMSVQELEFYEQDFPDKSLLINMSWKTECLGVLLWAMEKIGDFPQPNQQVDLNKHGAVLRDAISNSTVFIAQASLRPAAKLKAEEQTLYKRHWQVRDAQLRGNSTMPELHPGVVYEQRYALSWLVGWGDNWDDVPTDT